MFKTLKILLFILICMAGCQKHIVEPDVQEVYIEKIDTKPVGGINLVHT